jgi:hypothetical protein
VRKSHVLEAMGASEDGQLALRVSLGWTTTEADIEAFAKAWLSEYARAAQTARSEGQSLKERKSCLRLRKPSKTSVSWKLTSTSTASPPRSSRNTAPKGLSEDTIRFISAKKGEPEWLLDWRLDAYQALEADEASRTGPRSYPPIDYQDTYYYAAPKSAKYKSLDEVPQELLDTYESSASR